jgi:hypothetical protein
VDFHGSAIENHHFTIVNKKMSSSISWPVTVVWTVLLVLSCLFAIRALNGRLMDAFGSEVEVVKDDWAVRPKVVTHVGSNLPFVDDQYTSDDKLLLKRFNYSAVPTSIKLNRTINVSFRRLSDPLFGLIDSGLSDEDIIFLIDQVSFFK